MRSKIHVFSGHLKSESYNYKCQVYEIVVFIPLVGVLTFAFEVPARLFIFVFVSELPFPTSDFLSSISV